MEFWPGDIIFMNLEILKRKFEKIIEGFEKLIGN